VLDYRVIVVLIFLGFAVAELLAGRLLFRAETTRKDLILEIGAGLVLPLVIVPAIMAGSATITERIAPGSAGAWASWPGAAMLGILLLADDLTQYAWHRLSHSWPKLYLLHRAHHSAEYLSVRVVYRNNLIYYALMPSLWLSGALLYLGFAPVYYVYYIAKMAVIIGAHSSVAWDAKLLRVAWLRPLMWVVVRVFSTPSTHAAHHGKHAADGVTHYHGNYGNFLFVWDVLFKTAKISGERPREFGIEGLTPATWQQELLWPFERQPALGPDPRSNE
jgi:sterol desaturase/sphingolipid hydroxylase (fatty acid hydroxylase superfamily)